MAPDTPGSHPVPLPAGQVVGKQGKPTTKEQIATVALEMRASFDSGLTRPLAKRIEQLKVPGLAVQLARFPGPSPQHAPKRMQALRRFLVTMEEEMLEAIRKDLGRPRIECLLYDHATILAELDVCPPPIVPLPILEGGVLKTLVMPLHGPCSTPLRTSTSGRRQPRRASICSLSQAANTFNQSRWALLSSSAPGTFPSSWSSPL
jgi:hypothetical protein